MVEKNFEYVGESFSEEAIFTEGDVLMFSLGLIIFLTGLETALARLTTGFDTAFANLETGLTNFFKGFF